MTTDTLSYTFKPYEGSLPVFEHTEVHYRLATPSDELHLLTAFSRMLRELEAVGHNILPTERNIDLFTRLFMGAIEAGQHGIVVAFEGDACIGVTFFTPTLDEIDTRGRLAVAHGAWVEPSWRGQGVAKRMQALAHARLAELGYTQLVSVVMKDNTLGLRSALAAGAEVTGHYTTVNLLEAR